MTSAGCWHGPEPRGDTRRGIAFATVVLGITRALDDALARYDITSKLIMCFLRHLDEADAEATLDEALPYLGRIDGVGLDSSEVGHPPAKFERVFARARSLVDLAHNQLNAGVATQIDVTRAEAQLAIDEQSFVYTRWLRRRD